jgi:hypothetical protein
VHAWGGRSQRLQPIFPHTDLLGAFLLASQQFAEAKQGYRKVVIVFSDMRQSTPLLDLEHGSTVYKRSKDLKRAHDECPADMHGVEIHALGVDANGVCGAAFREAPRSTIQILRAKSESSSNKHSGTRL